MLEMQWYDARKASNTGFFGLRNAGVCDDKSHQVYRPNGTATYNLHLVCAGTGFVRQGDHELELGSGDLFFFEAGQAESYRSSFDQPWTVRWIHFVAPYATTWFESIGLLPHGVLHLCDTAPFIAKHQELLDQLRSSSINNDSDASQLVFACLESAFSHASASSVRLKPELGEALERVQNFIVSHLGQELDLRTLAAVALLSESRLSHLYKASFGESPMLVVRKRRISLAKTLLSNSKHLSIAEVGRRCGYPDDSHFCRVFRATCGQSPVEFRQSWP